MSQIFISHNSADNSVCEQLQSDLNHLGHRSIYLDFHPELGIPAGREWERELYRELRKCQAMIIVCSKDSMNSNWCFAEVTHAKALGKPIFPVRIDDYELHPILSGHQWIDWRSDRETALERLNMGLKAAGLDPASRFDWDGSRPPYPGLLAFDEADAAIFFGRETLIQQGLELLNQQRSFGGCGSLLVLGPSGSGKSSLVRAGMIPRLRANPAWCVLPTLRPRNNPIAELARALGQAPGVPADRQELDRRLREKPDALADHIERCLNHRPRKCLGYRPLTRCSTTLGNH